MCVVSEKGDYFMKSNSRMQIRSTKHEIRNKSEIQMFKIQNRKNLARWFFLLFWSFEFWSFEFVSDFDIRISDFLRFLQLTPFRITHNL
jgi:hypothetical protein